MAESRTQFTVHAEPRSTRGRSASRRLRRVGKLPGVMYGCNQQPVALAFDAETLEQRLGHEAFYSHILNLIIDQGEAHSVVLKDLQRHPVNSRPIHIDLQRIDQDVPLTISVPLHFLHEDRCTGVREGGGIISHILTEVDVHCLPRDLPEFISVDLEELALGQSLHLGDLQLPQGVQLHALLHGGDLTQPVVSVHLPRVSATAEEEAEQADTPESTADTEDPAATT